MTPDLHDIDDLFRDGLEGHEEAVPAEVWQGVSSNLDQKQASYYKHKYDRLRYAAALLLLLCVLGAIYVTFDAVNDRRTTGTTNGKETTTAPVFSQQEKQQPPAGSVATGKETSQPVEQKKNGAMEEETVPSHLNDHLTGIDQNAIAQTVRKKQASDVGVPVFSSKAITVSNGKRRSFAPKEKINLPAAGQPAENSFAGPSLAASKEIFGLKYFFLPPKDLRLPAIAPQVLPQHLAINLPPKKAPSKAKAKPGFSLAAFVAPNISFDRLEDDDHLAGPGRNRQAAHHDEEKNHSFSGGLLVSYGLSAKLSLQSGVTVTSSSTTIAPKTVYAKADNNGHARYELPCSSGYVYFSPKGSVQPAVGDSAETTGTKSRLLYVGVPVALRYDVQLGRLSLSPTIGAGLNLLVSGRTSTNLLNTAGSKSTTASISGLKSSYLDGQVGFGVAYGLTKGLSLHLSPTARLALTPINRETPVKSYQNFLSVETGVRVKL